MSQKMSPFIKKSPDLREIPFYINVVQTPLREEMSKEELYKKVGEHVSEVENQSKLLLKQALDAYKDCEKLKIDITNMNAKMSQVARRSKDTKMKMGFKCFKTYAYLIAFVVVLLIIFSIGRKFGLN
ncbi:hypothetical protein EDEG_03340 [Edhazardia aedis USNM 41457]|uniref:V-SNARE coiled-coil homology domain-containing protein n=1 Tax=Edhazardia aedis (strain USNM 41457) TaxID=1003232 RepID=J9DLI5_EDHAE|nr:hypothetical protein EDEG_03340 [Edhazardia aedis USNM 41457]|eukprot:EJW02222.1 hypothetical protein EDEG_03340 [Edhazardia aedis USNM 41457]